MPGKSSIHRVNRKWHFFKPHPLRTTEARPHLTGTGWGSASTFTNEVGALIGQIGLTMREPRPSRESKARMTSAGGGRGKRHEHIERHERYDCSKTTDSAQDHT